MSSGVVPSMVALSWLMHVSFVILIPPVDLGVLFGTSNSVSCTCTNFVHPTWAVYSIRYKFHYSTCTKVTGYPIAWRCGAANGDKPCRAIGDRGGRPGKQPGRKRFVCKKVYGIRSGKGQAWIVWLESFNKERSLV